MDLRNARVLVTGASAGIGRATAFAFGMQGTQLAISGRRQKELAALADAVVAAGGARPLILTADLAQPGAARALAARAFETLGSLDVLINNAAAEGVGFYADALDDRAARELFDLNYWSPMELVRAVIPAMRQAGRGAIVNVSSLGAITPIAGTGHYPSTKAALAAATEALRNELRGTGIQVVLVYPGFVDTPMLRAFHARALPPSWRPGLRMMPVGQPEKLARLIVAAVRRGRKVVVYPRLFSLAPHFPAVSRWLTSRLFPAATSAPAAPAGCAWLAFVRAARSGCCG
jgi:short-subunit dehydrogenase